MRSIHCLILPAVAVAGAGLGPAASAETLTFETPTHSGYAISYCGTDPASCGEAVATAWCRAQGYQYAQEWAAAAGDASTATVRIDDGAICRGAQCDSLGSVTCGREVEPPRLRLGAAARATMISPSRRIAAVTYESSGFAQLIPGCHQTEPGVYLCETVHDFQHCRTLMRSGNVFSCRAGLAFDGGFARPVSPRPGGYTFELQSNAEVRVERDARGEGRIRGAAEVEILFEQPTLDYAFWCLQRDRYVYHTTGPSGGLADIDDTADCDTPVSARFEPDEDHLLMAYDLCTAMDSWGEEIEHSFDVIVAALFHIDSASPRFRSEYGGSAAVIAPYLTVKAPLKIACRD